MKKALKIATLMVVGALLVTGCGKRSDIAGFKKTQTGLHYKFDVENKKAQAVKKGDVLVCEVQMSLDTALLYDNFGSPQRMFKVQDPMFKGDLPEGLMMMHMGDEATFAIEMDSLARFFNPQQLPPMYVANKGMKLFYSIKLRGIVSEAEIQQEEANYMEAMQQRKASEPEDIAKYIEENNITVEPDEQGLYVIVERRGNGQKVAPGKHVKINYTGSLLNGQVFDTSLEPVAHEAGIYMANRPYEPLEYVVGEMSLIEGWELGIMGQPQGTKVKLVIPSALGYGTQRASEEILPYTPLVFEIEILEVK